MSLQEYLPSKRFIFSLLGLLLGLELIFVINSGIHFKKNKQAASETSLSKLGLVTEEQALKNLDVLNTQDTDEDGLLDWEEILWGTNPTLVDSDGNGMNDFDEVADIKKKIEVLQGSEQGDIPETITELDKVSRDLYATLAILDQKGELNPETEAQVTEIIEEKILLTFNYPPITLPDLQIASDSNEDKIAFITQFMHVLEMYPILENDFIFITNNSLSLIKQQEALDVIQKYDQYLADMLAIPVPVDGQEYFLNFLNGIKGIAEANRALLYSDIDSMVGVSAATQMPQIFQLYHDSLSKIFAIINS